MSGTRQAEYEALASVMRRRKGFAVTNMLDVLMKIVILFSSDSHTYINIYLYMNYNDGEREALFLRSAVQYTAMRVADAALYALPGSLLSSLDK